MCDAAAPIDVLKSLRFSLASLANLAGTPGSHEREGMRMAMRGIRGELDWCIAQLESAKEGQKNCGVMPYEWLSKSPRTSPGAET